MYRGRFTGWETSTQDLKDQDAEELTPLASLSGVVTLTKVPKYRTEDGLAIFSSNEPLTHTLSVWKLRFDPDQLERGKVTLNEELSSAAGKVRWRGESRLQLVTEF